MRVTMKAVKTHDTKYTLLVDIPQNSHDNASSFIHLNGNQSLAKHE